VEELDLFEQVYVQDVSCHVVEKEIYFIRFARHVPFKQMATVPIPVSLVGVYGCPGQLRGGHVNLTMPTINCEIVGDRFPAPFLVDCSRLGLMGIITLADIQKAMLEQFEGTVRFAREYENLTDHEVASCYDPKSNPEQPLPQDYDDPNFHHRQGKYHVTYTGYWPKQYTRG